MYDHCDGLPRCGVDPIDHPAIAERLIRATTSVPAEFEIVALLLDRRRCCVSLMLVHDCFERDGVLDVADAIIASALHRDVDTVLGGVVLASVRPGTAGADDFDDIDRWLELTHRFEATRLELVEWFVLSDDVAWCPRALIGETPRW